MPITAEQQKALDMVLGDPALVGVVKTALGAQTQSKMATEAGIVRKVAQTSTNLAPVPEPTVVFKTGGQHEATPQQSLGFGVTKAADAGKEDPEEEAAEDPKEEMAEDDKQEKAVTDPVPADQTQAARLSDEDLQGIAAYVNETVTKAVSAAVEQMTQTMTGEITKMQRVFSVQTQAKLLNEVPANTHDRLKAFGLAAAPGIPAKLIDPMTGQQITNPEYVEKGNNLPSAPDNPVGQLMEYLGFGS